MSSKDLILEVIQTVDGYIIKDSNANRWWGDTGWRYSRNTWGYYRRTAIQFRWKWSAIRKAKKLEYEDARNRREEERRRTFVEKKVWR